MDDDRLIIVSSDSHAGIPTELWPEYMAKPYHDLIPRLHEDHHIYQSAIYLLGTKSGTSGFSEHQKAHREEFHGLHDAGLRIADMDREGVAAELIYHGDFRLGDLFHNVTGREYPLEVWEAGARGWNRWAADNFGFATDRFLLTGAIGPCTDMDATVAELEWIADRSFVGTYGPGYMRTPDLPPLSDPYWEPFWRTCEERGLAIVVHAGFGTVHGHVFPVLEGMYNDVRKAAGSEEREALFAHAHAISEESSEFFTNFLNHNVDSRRPIWQMMLGGVFDRHPGLKLMPTEIRLDWLPATLRHLDAIFEKNRSDLPAERRPSEYWRSNCLAGASFIHKAEVEMRHEIGIESISFGRDFPHPEGTWPHTRDFLRLAFEGVPEDEVRLMLGENAIRFLDLDRERLAEIAKRVGPRIEEVNGAGWEVRPELVESFATRGGFLKPAEGEAKLPLVDELLREDLARFGARF